MTRLKDKARELVSICEGEIQKREITIVGLHRKVEQMRKELDEARVQQLAVRHPKCEGCAYKVIALKVLEKEEKVKK